MEKQGCATAVCTEIRLPLEKRAMEYAVAEAHKFRIASENPGKLRPFVNCSIATAMRSCYHRYCRRNPFRPGAGSF